ncbi:Carbohydrate esterase 4 protein [Rhizophlyctis rosea]|nr:Carbohydrate esterase 4 protein [Rhizophlyctis rosea]
MLQQIWLLWNHQRLLWNGLPNTSTTTRTTSTSTSTVGSNPTGVPQSTRIPNTGGQIVTKCSVPGTAALTFDDGPYIYNTELRNTLKAAGMKTTFFLNGNNYGCIFDYGSTLTALLADGHQIASHTWAHPDIATLTDDQLNYQMRKNEDAFMKLIGMTPTYFRPPFGSYNTQNTNLIMNTLGYRFIVWDTDSGDSSGYTVAQSEAALASSLGSGDQHIVLDHETHQETVQQIVPWIIKNYGSKYRWVTVAECLGDTSYPYMIVPTLDNGRTCSESDRSGSLAVGK